jgi:hypothetical protein
VTGYAGVALDNDVAQALFRSAIAGSAGASNAFFSTGTD